MGLRRALCCCCRGDQDDDGQNLAPRPSQTQFDKPTEKPPKEKRPLTPRNLWKEAYDSLDRDCQKYVPSTGIPATKAIQGVIDTTTKNFEKWEKGGLKIHHKNGKDTDLRAWTENILAAAMKAQGIISTAVSFDPTGHASSAWTVISFGMSIVQNRLDRRDAIFQSSEYLTEKLAYFALIDFEYRNQDVGTDNNIDQALLRVYSALLRFTSEVKKAQSEHEIVSVWTSIFPLTDQALSKLKTVLDAESENARKWIDLAANIGDRTRAREHLAVSEEAVKNSRNIEARIKTLDEENKLKWLTKDDFSTRQLELQSRRTPETGIWFVNSQEYNSWKYNPGKILWLGGISGCGKSVLCSTVIEDLQDLRRMDPSNFVAWWYFQFDKGYTRSVDAVTRAWIRQLSQSPLLPSFMDIYNEHGRAGSQPNHKAILALLDDVLSRTEGQIYLVLDALDECPQIPGCKERASLLSLMLSIVKKHSDKVHIIATSRPEDDIMKKIGKSSMVDLETRLVEDVKEFVTAAISDEPLERYSEKGKKQIFDTLLSSRERRFRWAELQIKVLQGKHDEEDVLKALTKLPQSLEETYRAVLDGIPPDDVPRARDILVLICLSPVTLDVSTAAQMARVWASDILSICTTSLVNVFQDKIQVAHFSVQEFLVLSDEDSKKEHHECQFTVVEGHRRLAEIAVDYLLAQTKPLVKADAINMHWMLYAAQHWHTHLALAGDIDQSSPELQAKIDRLFAEPDVYFNWIRGSNDNVYDDQWSKVLVECEPPIHKAASLGLIRTVTHLVAQGADCLQIWDETDTLSVAAAHGHVDIVQALLGHNLPLNQQVANSILANMNHRQAGQVKLLLILDTLLAQGLLQADDARDTLREDLVISAMRNQWSSVEIVSILLSWQAKVTFPLTDKVLVNAILWARSPRAILKLLSENCDFRVPSAALVRGMNANLLCDTEGLTFLAMERPNELPVTERLITMFAMRGKSESIKSFLQARREEVKVTQVILGCAALNSVDAGMIPLLWDYREPGTEVTEIMLMRATTNSPRPCETVRFLLEHWNPGSTLDKRTTLEIIRTSKDGLATLKMLQSLPNIVPLNVSEGLISAACLHRDALGMLKFLAADDSVTLPVTEWIVSLAASNQADASSLLTYLEQLSKGRLPVTEMTLLQAISNSAQGDRALRVLMQQSPDIVFTDRVFESACRNKDAMAMLLDKHPKEPPLEKILSEILRVGDNSNETLRLLLERQLLDADEHLVARLAGHFDALNVLFSWKPDISIPENALIVNMTNPRAFRLILARQIDSFAVTEDLLITGITGSAFADELLEIMLNRQESLPITNKVIRAACKQEDHDAIQWLLNHQSEAQVRGVWQDVWADRDFSADAKLTVLTVFLKRTNSKITDTMLHDLPYDRDCPRKNVLQTLVSSTCGLDSDSESEDSESESESEDESEDSETESESEDEEEEEEKEEKEEEKEKEKEKEEEKYEEENDKTREMKELFSLPRTERTAELVVERCNRKSIEAFLKLKEITVTEGLLKAAERNCIANNEELVANLKEIGGSDSRGLAQSPPDRDSDSDLERG